jgi:hypothetical protein
MEVNEYSNLFANLGHVLLLINCCLFVKSSFKQEKAFKIFSFYLLLIAVIQIVMATAHAFGIHNIYLSHFYFISRFVILSFFYHTLFKKTTHKKVVKGLNIMVLSILTIQYIVSPSAFGKSFNLLEIVLTNLSLVFFSVIHFSNALLQKTKYIYLNSGILFYLVGSTLIFCAGNFTNINGTGNTQNVLWLYNAVLFVIYLIFIFLEWYKNYRKT